MNIINGYGVNKYRKGIYTGQWKNSLPHGLGHFIIDDIKNYEEYTGNFVNGEKHGDNSVCKYSDGVFTGSFRENLKTQGIYKYNTPDNKTYNGSFLHNVIYGYGELTTNLYKIIGHFDMSGLCNEGEYHCFRTFTLFKGTLQCNLPHSGELIYPNGKKIVGCFNVNCNNPQNIIYYSNNDVYKGNMVNNNKHGNGTMYFDKTKMTYTATFTDDKVDIIYEGTIYDDINKVLYKGTIVRSKPHGYGVVLNCITNSTYTGSFIKGEKHGILKHYNGSTGKTTESIYAKNKNIKFIRYV